MGRRFHRTRLGAVAISLAFGLSLVAQAAEAEGWGDSEATETSAGNLDQHEEESRSPDGMTVESQNPDDMVVESERMDGRVVDAENPAAMVAPSGQMDGREVTSEGFSDPHQVAPDAGAVSIMVPGQADWVPTTDPQVLLARQHLVRAQERARAAITAYGDAEERNYPRGQARIRIVNERDAAMQALEEAKRALAEAE